MSQANQAHTGQAHPGTRHPGNGHPGNGAKMSLRVAVADDEVEIVEYLRDVVQGLGHTVTAGCTSGDALVQACLVDPPDLIITDVKMPGMDGIEAAGRVTRRVPTPVILVTSFCESDIIRRALTGSVLAYLMKPVGANDLEAAIALSMRRFREFQAMRDQATVLRQTLEERKQVERAKGVLMRRAGLGEEEAFKRLQRMSTEQSQKMSETARMIIAVDKAFRPSGFASEGSTPRAASSNMPSPNLPLPNLPSPTARSLGRSDAAQENVAGTTERGGGLAVDDSHERHPPTTLAQRLFQREQERERERARRRRRLLSCGPSAPPPSDDAQEADENLSDIENIWR